MVSTSLVDLRIHIKPLCHRGRVGSKILWAFEVYLPHKVAPVASRGRFRWYVEEEGGCVRGALVSSPDLLKGRMSALDVLLGGTLSILRYNAS